MFVVQTINSICNSWQTYIVQTMHLRWETLILRPCTVCETLSHLCDYGKFYIDYMHHVWMIAESLHVRYINIRWRQVYKCRYRNVKHENIKAVNKKQKGNCGRNFIDESHKTRIPNFACTPTSNLMEAWWFLATQATVGGRKWACPASKVQLYANDERLSGATTNKREAGVVFMLSIFWQILRGW